MFLYTFQIHIPFAGQRICLLILRFLMALFPRFFLPDRSAFLRSPYFFGLVPFRSWWPFTGLEHQGANGLALPRQAPILHLLLASRESPDPMTQGVVSPGKEVTSDADPKDRSRRT